MARQQCIKIICDRCKRDELRPADKNDSKKLNDFTATLKGKELVYADLCNRCYSTLENLWIKMLEWQRDINPEHEIKDPESAAPLNVPPTYSPPKPHSQEASKR